MVNNRPIHNNVVCPVCGKHILCAADCMRYRAVIHLNHCEQCEYFQPMFWHCTFAYKKDAR